MYFRQFWQDPRLSFNEPGLEKLVVGAEYIKLIWVPDTFFVNEKTAYFHDATTENQFLRILHTGEILRSIRWVVPDKIQLMCNTTSEIWCHGITANSCSYYQPIQVTILSVWVQLDMMRWVIARMLPVGVWPSRLCTQLQFGRCTLSQKRTVVFIYFLVWI